MAKDSSTNKALQQDKGQAFGYQNVDAGLKQIQHQFAKQN